MKTRIYAELRQSIRCISLSVEVQDRAQLKDVEVSGSGEEVVVRFKDGTGSVMKLPAKGQRGPLAIPVGTGGTLQFRIPLDDAKVVDLSPTAVEVNAPWCVKDLEACKQDVAIHCRNCQADIVSSGAVEEWRALPSSGWAEMMDIWHCHKPTEEDTAKAEKEGQTMKKKYGSGFIEKPGIGLVGLTEIMVHESNCSNIEIKNKDKKQMLHCEACGSELGEIIKTNLGLRSFTKWSLSINVDSKGSRTRDLQQFPISAFVGVRLLTLIEEQAVRHFFLPPPPGFNHLCGMRIWVFHPDVTVSASPVPTTVDQMPFRAMKIFYIADSELEARDDFKEDTMQLPVSAWKAFRDDLMASTNALPVNERTWKVWSIGLIQRF